MMYSQQQSTMLKFRVDVHPGMGDRKMQSTRPEVRIVFFECESPTIPYGLFVDSDFSYHRKLVLATNVLSNTTTVRPFLGTKYPDCFAGNISGWMEGRLEDFPGE
jgi:hypothetical protein